MGPWAQIKNMLDPSRAVATLLYLASLVLTLWAGLGLKSVLLALIFVILEFCALFWYRNRVYLFSLREGMDYHTFRLAGRPFDVSSVGFLRCSLSQLDDGTLSMAFSFFLCARTHNLSAVHPLLEALFHFQAERELAGSLCRVTCVFILLFRVHGRNKAYGTSSHSVAFRQQPKAV